MEEYNNELSLQDQDRGRNFFFVTIILAITNIIAFLFEIISPGDYYLQGGMNYSLVVGEGQYYRFFTSIFLHGDIVHIGMNMLALVAAGVLVESYLGSFRTAIIYFVSGIGGSVLSLLWHQGDKEVYSIGASGAIFGLLVASAIIQNKKQGKSMMAALGFVIFYAVATYSEGIDLTGHLGGAIGGGIASFLLSRNFREDYKENRLLCVLGILLTLGICGVSFCLIAAL